ncbi:DUF4260 domain-containing protein [Saccharibacillus sp. CPCC 101409]|uniref:DUF4260 domain-containing protein n=1 Tax=Saccharibacillus sp. CPCC 101409 TaxID=3058041 RepID=UPI002671E35C|nr:DUF4260 domain-containing protein [Saccharibacillus sp. CPCC 101409]MDO3409761.1 DUF4260 domain-containing protein [Saccharibacillus sp. CPCC 101409]
MNKRLIRIEGLVMLALGAYLYFANGYGWLPFLLLLFAPDLSMLGYAVNTRVGAYAYNAAHTFVVPLLLTLAGLAFSADLPLMIGLIWTAHIGLDRMMGYGLRYATGFQDTHIQRL